MPAAAALRLQIEHALASRFPSALTPAPLHDPRGRADGN